jgi:hypothetical protein
MGICNPKNEQKTIENPSSIKLKKLKIPQWNDSYTIEKIKDLDEYYIEKNDNKYIIFYHSKDYTLPLDGWIHECIICSMPVSRIHKHSIISNKEIYFQLCNTCWKKKTTKNLMDFDTIIYKINIS